MKNIKFTEHLLPHIIAIAVFFIVTIFFFKPYFFDNKTLVQHDIQQFSGGAQSIVEHREKVGEEPLWLTSMFSGMPSYLVSVNWGNKAIGYTKKVISLFLPHPISNIFVAFICYYIMLLAFRVRPYLAIGGALAFGLSSYMIIGLGAGHNTRIGAIGFMPLVIAGIHLLFSARKILGFGVTAIALALHLFENHLQITYYLVLIAGVYYIIRSVDAVKQKMMPEHFKITGLLVIASILSFGTYFGQFWSITEYGAYSIRGKSELIQPGSTSTDKNLSGLNKEYAFEYSNGILEPLTLLIPNFYGGGTSNFLVQDQKSETYKALVNSNDQQMANQLVSYTSAYWGPQHNTAPYYGGAIIVFLFVIGILFAEKKYIWWLVPLCVLSIIFSWGKNFSALNNFFFDYLPGYNKFRSVTFATIIILFAMPLLGLLGLEKILTKGVDKAAKKKILIAFASTGGLCLLLAIFAGLFSFTREGENQLPTWLTDALIDDRKSLLIQDALRSFGFICVVFIALYFDVHKRISATGFYFSLILFIVIDLSVVDKRHLSNDSFQRKRDNTFFTMTEADQEILKDKSYYRVYNLQSPFNEARTSYYHNSAGGYHGAKLRRYQDFFDSCLVKQQQQFITQAQQGNMDMSNLGAFNMLNIKYLVYGQQRNNVIPNQHANGSVWFVQNIVQVNSPTEELDKSCDINTKTTAVIDGSKFSIPQVTYDSTATITLIDRNARQLKYESNSQTNNLAVFSEIYYPKGWIATIDGKESPIIRANYILRALEVPAGKHTIEFKFEPDAYYIGNKVTMAASWLTVLILLGTIVLSIREKKA
jgi:hypothetical protein